jgi:hypothetical protein
LLHAWNTIGKEKIILETDALSVVNKDRLMWMEINNNLCEKKLQAARVHMVQNSKKDYLEIFSLLVENPD